MMITARQTHPMLRTAILALVLLTALFGLSAVSGADPAFAASKVKLSKTRITVQTGAKVKLSVKNAGKKVKWTTSDKKRVAISKKSGKKKQNVVLKAGKKTGTCWIKAKVGKKTLKCKVTVKGKAGSTEPKVLPLSKSSVDLSAKYPYSAATDKDSDTAFDKAYTDFAVRLLQETIRGDSSTLNILISPDSVMTALTMTENGAAGETKEEMQKVLSGSVTASDVNKYLYRMHSRLSGSQGLIYRNSNSIWAKKGVINAAPDFLKTNKKYYKASFYGAPFNNDTISDMNKWVYNNSRNMIRKIIEPNGLSEDARLVLINAVAFEGPWSKPLNTVSKDSDKVFTAADHTEQKVTMLAGTGDGYLELANGQGFCYNYSSKDIAFVGILPPEGASVRTWAATLSGEDLSDAWKNRTVPKGGVVFHLPAFKYDYSASMKDVLKAMGMKKAFSAGADFSGMIDPSGPDPKQSLQIDDVLHKTHIELDQNGTRAAAATAVILEKSSAPVDQPEYVYLDRPFLYGLIDTKTGNPLFLGIVEKIQ
ncbi:MAG: hypothetical protein IJ128_04220 [Firmicutes bacterium]|nr:hypothetical protein [Bacillota bacterium]